MHEGHGILKDPDKEFEKKFCCNDCKTKGNIDHRDHDHKPGDNDEHDHGHGKEKSSKVVEIVAGIIVGIIILAFIYWKFIR